MVNTFSERLNFAMQEAGISPSQLERYYGFSRNSLAKWRLRPDANPTIETVTRLANTLQVHPAWLAFGTLADDLL